MNSINFKKELLCDFESAISRTTEALKKEGFGVLTRIDFHSKMKEKLNQDMPPLVILGACNPSLAFQAYSRSPDVTSLLPCNTVVRQLSAGRISVEVAKPSAMMEILGDPELTQMACEADLMLKRAIENL